MKARQTWSAALVMMIATIAQACAPDLTLGPLPGAGGNTGAGGGGAGGSGAGSTGSAMTGTGASGGGTNHGGVPTWVTSLSGDTVETPRTLLRDQNGGLLLAVQFNGGLGIGKIDSNGAEDVAVVRLTATGEPITAVQLGGTSSETVRALVQDSGGNILVAGDFSGSIVGGAKQANSAGGRDGYLAKLDSTGGVIWITAVGGTGYDSCVDVAVDSGDGTVVTAGTFTGQIDGNIASAGGEDAFIMKLAPTGERVWALPFGDGHAQRARSVAVGSDGTIVVLADIEGTFTVGADEIASKGGTDILLLKLDRDGAVSWTKGIGTAGEDAAGKLLVDAAGNIVISGTLGSNADLGDGVIAGQGFVAAFDGDGALLYSRGWTSDAAFIMERLTVDEKGSVLVTGGFSGTLEVGETALSSAGGEDAFVVKLGEGGKVEWARGFGGADNERGSSVTVGESGTVVVAGTYVGSTMLGEEALGPAQGQDIFMMGLTP